MNLDKIKAALLASYETDGGINHLDGVNLPSQGSVNAIARDCMHLLFPGYFEESRLSKKDVPGLVDTLLGRIRGSLEVEIEKSLRFSRDADPPPMPGRSHSRSWRSFPSSERPYGRTSRRPTGGTRPPGAMRRSSSPTPASSGSPCSASPTCSTGWRSPSCRG